MSAPATFRTRSRSSPIPRLENGDHLDQPTFHARYEAMPAGFRAELIGGVVYVPSPLKSDHGDFHSTIIGWLFTYRTRTRGVRVKDNATDILGPDSEPQPDAFLVIEGGQTTVNADGYVQGPPELIVEVASSSASYDLHEKRRDYEKYGVGEYVVVLVQEARVVWYARTGGPTSGFSEIAAGPNGIYQSYMFPGLWLDSAALFRDDDVRLVEVLNEGMATPEHAAFAAGLLALRKQS
jgi:Uma2 family endonuclease